MPACLPACLYLFLSKTFIISYSAVSVVYYYLLRKITNVIIKQHSCQLACQLACIFFFQKTFIISYSAVSVVYYYLLRMITNVIKQHSCQLACLLACIFFFQKTLIISYSAVSVVYYYLLRMITNVIKQHSCQLACLLTCIFFFQKTFIISYSAVSVVYLSSQSEEGNHPSFNLRKVERIKVDDNKVFTVAFQNIEGFNKLKLLEFNSFLADKKPHFFGVTEH